MRRRILAVIMVVFQSGDFAIVVIWIHSPAPVKGAGFSLSDGVRRRVLQCITPGIQSKTPFNPKVPYHPGNALTGHYRESE